MRLVARTLNRWWLVWPVIGIYAALAAIPAWVWYTPGVQIVSRDSGGVLTVTQERRINFFFLGAYSVIVRSANGLDPVCDGVGGPFTYLKNNGDKPASMPLSDWAGGGCADLPPGNYIMETCWTVLRPLWGALPPKTVCVRSDVFEVPE